MHFEVHPGGVYAFPVPRAPSRRKVGKAASISGRMGEHQTSNDELLTGAVWVYFLNCVAAESFIKRRLTEMGRHIRGEFFVVSEDEFLALAQEYKLLELAQAQALASAAQYLHVTSYFDGTVPYPGSVSAVGKLLLEHTVKKANMVTSVGALIQASLRASDPRDGERRLESIGLVLSQACGTVLLDKREGGKLHRLLDRTAAAKTWRAQLSSYAGFDADLQPVYASAFKKSKMATPHLIEISCRE